MGQPVDRIRAVARQEGAVEFLGQHRRLLEERDAHLVEPGRHRHADPQHLVRGERLRHADHRLDVPDLVVEVGSANAEQPGPHPVDGDLDVVRLAQAADPGLRRPLQEGTNLVLRVEGKVVPRRQAAAGPERQAVERVVLRMVGRRPVGVRRCPHGRAADGRAADDARRRQVLLEEQRRHPQHVRDVVEAVARIIRRQEARHVDLERQQIADDVRVLRAVQAVQGAAARIRRAGGGLIECRRELRGQCVVLRVVGPRPARGRHLPRLQLAEHPLPGGRARRDVRDVEPFEHDARRAKPPVVTGHAVALDQRPVRGRDGLLRRRGGRRSGLRRPGGARQDDREQRKATRTHRRRHSSGHAPHPSCRCRRLAVRSRRRDLHDVGIVIDARPGGRVRSPRGRSVARRRFHGADSGRAPAAASGVRAGAASHVAGSTAQTPGAHRRPRRESLDAPSGRL